VIVPELTETVPPDVIEVLFKFTSEPLVPTVVKSHKVTSAEVVRRAKPAVPVAAAVAVVTVPSVITPEAAVPSTPEITSVASNVPAGDVSALVGAAPE
jgi:hypothetical protein